MERRCNSHGDPDGVDLDKEPVGERHTVRRDSWHVAHDIPVALIFTLALQTGGGIWWASGVTSKLDRAIEQISEFKQDRYTKEDGRRDQALLFQMLEGLRQSDRDLERRVLNCEQAAFETPNGKRK